MTGTRRRIYTVGHSNHPTAKFIDLLRLHSVTAVADVRSAPYSKFAPQFSRETLRAHLSEAGIKYAFLGRELGARSSDPDCFENGKVRYDRLARTDLFKTGLERLAYGSESETVAVLCTEKDPLDCHRTLLVARELVGQGLEVDHILADGSLETYEASLLRLVDKTGQTPDFFTTDAERIDKALAEQEARIAYVDEELVRASKGTPS